MIDEEGVVVYALWSLEDCGGICYEFETGVEQATVGRGCIISRLGDILLSYQCMRVVHALGVSILFTVQHSACVWVTSSVL